MVWKVGAGTLLNFTYRYTGTSSIFQLLYTKQRIIAGWKIVIYNIFYLS